jgi:hypothetical protein
VAAFENGAQTKLTCWRLWSARISGPHNSLLPVVFRSIMINAGCRRDGKTRSRMGKLDCVVYYSGLKEARAIEEK